MVRREVILNLLKKNIDTSFTFNETAEKLKKEYVKIYHPEVLRTLLEKVVRTFDKIG